MLAAHLRNFPQILFCLHCILYVSTRALPLHAVKPSVVQPKNPAPIQGRAAAVKQTPKGRAADASGDQNATANDQGNQIPPPIDGGNATSQNDTAPQNPAPQNPAPQNPAPQNPAPQNPAPQNPAPQNPAPPTNNGPKKKGRTIGWGYEKLLPKCVNPRPQKGKWVQDPKTIGKKKKCNRGINNREEQKAALDALEAEAKKAKEDKKAAGK